MKWSLVNCSVRIRCVGRFFSEDNANAGLIGGGVPVSHVMHLEHEIGTGGDKFRGAIGPVVGRTSGGVDQKNVGGGEVRVVAVLAAGHIGCCEGNANGCVLEPI